MRCSWRLLAAAALVLGGCGQGTDGATDDPSADGRPRVDGDNANPSADPPVLYELDVPATVREREIVTVRARLGAKAGRVLHVTWRTTLGTIDPGVADVTADDTGNALAEATLTAPDELGTADLALTVHDDFDGEVGANRSVVIARPEAYTLGTTTSWPDDPDAFAYDANRLLAQAIVVDHATELLGLGVVANDAGPHMRTALYTDRSDAPDRLVTTGAEVRLVAGANVATVEPIRLEPGTYWLGTLFDVNANLAEDTPRRDEPRRRVLYGYMQPWMDTFPNPLDSMGPTASFFLVVQDP